MAGLNTRVLIASNWGVLLQALGVSMMLAAATGCAYEATPLTPTKTPLPTSLQTQTPLAEQRLVATVAPPLPEARFENRIRVEDGAYLFEYDGADERLRYRYFPATGSLHDLTVEVEEQPAFWVSAFGGPTFVLQRGEVPIWEADALARSHSVRLSPSELEVAWQFEDADGSRIAYVYRLSIQGKTLRLEVESDSQRLSAFSLDRSEATPGARILALPYLATFDVLFYQGRLITAFFDWTRASASAYEKVSQPYSEQSFHFSQMAIYRPNTLGVRQRMRETIYITVSSRLIEVLPQIPNPPSPYRAALAGKVKVDFWTEGPFTESQVLVETLHSRGVTDLVIVRHTWQRCGYDNCYPSVLPANQAWGSDAGLRALSQAVQRAGYYFALHENYTDFYPNSDLWSPDRVGLDERGQPRPGWFNRTTGIQAYLLSPSHVLSVAAQFSPEIHRRYGTTAAFVDVHTAVPPWYKTDYSARAAEGGRFLPVWRAYIDLLAFLRSAHNGPVLGEGGAHFLYAGFVDGVAAQLQEGLDPGQDVPPLVDFALKRIHPLMVSFGVGYFPFYFGQGDKPKWSGYTVVEHYRYMATEIAFCHAGYVDSPEGFESSEAWLAWVEREVRLVSPIHRWCALSEPVRTRYHVNGALASVEEAIAADQPWQVLVEYRNGLHIYVNRHPTDTWQVSLEFAPSWVSFSALVDGKRVDFTGLSQGNQFLLPPDGWLAALP